MSGNLISRVGDIAKVGPFTVRARFVTVAAPANLDLEASNKLKSAPALLRTAELTQALPNYRLCMMFM